MFWNIMHRKSYEFFIFRQLVLFDIGLILFFGFIFTSSYLMPAAIQQTIFFRNILLKSINRQNINQIAQINQKLGFATTRFPIYCAINQIIMLDERILGSTQYPPHCLVTCDQECILNLYNYGFIISVIFAVITSLAGLYNVVMHYINFNNPYFQSKIIIILLMPPIYAITSALSFISIKTSVYLTLARDFYEVFALFAFFYLMFSFLAFDHEKNELNERKVYQILKIQAKQVPHDYPCSYFQKPYQLSSWIKAKFFSHRCKRAIMQFILLKIVTSALFSIVYPNYELRSRDSNDWDYVFYQNLNTIVYWILTISSYVAYYYLTLFFNALAKPLQPFKPDLKFFTFNTAIFFTYWQKVWMVIFQNDIIDCFDSGAASFSMRKIMLAIEHVLICFQMVVMIFAAAQAYNYQDYKLRTIRNFGSIQYIIIDIFKIFVHELRLVKPKKMGFSATTDEAETQLLTITHSHLRNSNQTLCNKHLVKSLAGNIKQNYF